MGIVLFVAAVTVAAWSTGLPSRPVGTVLNTAGLVGALLLVVMAALAWRATGRSAPVWLAVAGIAVAVTVGLRLTHLEPQLLSGLVDVEASRALAAASRIVALAAFASAALWRPVDTRVRPLGALLAAGGGIALLALPLALSPSVASTLASPAAAAARAVTEDAGGALVAPLPAVLPALWALAGGILAVQAQRRRDPVLAWTTLLALTMAGAETLRQLVGTPEAFLAADLARTGALLAAAVGVGADVLRLTTLQRRELGTALQASKDAEGRLQGVDAAQAELRHEIHNALTGVHAAAAMLHLHQDRLSVEHRAELAEAVGREVERLRLMLDSRSSTVPLRAVGLAAAIRSPVTSARAQGLTVHVDVPDDLEVLARQQQLVQVLTILLDNARKHAPGSPVWLRAAAQPEGVVLRCDDHGPGISPDERQLLFERGRRGRNAGGAGDGLGLAVAVRLVREQGGGMWIDDHPGGGASLAVWLARPVAWRELVADTDHPGDAAAADSREDDVSADNPRTLNPKRHRRASWLRLRSAHSSSRR